MKLPNIVVRLLAGIVFVGLLVGGILINKYTFLGIFSLIIALALYEFYTLMEKNVKVAMPKTLNIVGGVLLFGGMFLYKSLSTIGLENLYFVPYGIYLLTLFIYELYAKRENPIKSLAYSVLGQVYIALPLTLANSLVFFNGIYVPTAILAVLVFIWVNDSFAYLTGRMFGKHKLFERISPKKSWEGFIGGLIFAAASSFFFYYFSADHSISYLFTLIGLAIVVVICGTFGDLTESLMKRTLGVKDSGNMIPGHGGILDRFDSTILAIPGAFVFLEIVYYITFYLL